MMASEVRMVPVMSFGQLPSGVRVLEVACADYDAFSALPKAVGLDGRRYGLTGWNSDRGVAYYRSDAMMAEVL